ncbi:hypothetical protein [Streptomyces flaveolus]|uniref:hypothetical protein n=1 Tax=Streptomyces flaveolus TaxID=67297 RepID=UPI0036F79858
MPGRRRGSASSARTCVRPGTGTRVLAIVLEGTALLHGASVRLGRLDAVLFSEQDLVDTIGVDGVLAVVDLVDRPGH